MGIRDAVESLRVNRAVVAAARSDLEAVAAADEAAGQCEESDAFLAANARVGDALADVPAWQRLLIWR